MKYDAVQRNEMQNNCIFFNKSYHAGVKGRKISFSFVVDKLLVSLIDNFLKCPWLFVNLSADYPSLKLKRNTIVINNDNNILW